jgi:hypothetical protein
VAGSRGGLGSASGSYDPSTGQTSGSVSSASGHDSASWNANVDSGTGSGSVTTQHGSGTIAVDDTQIHATVDVPGMGSVAVDLDRPSWL